MPFSLVKELAERKKRLENERAQLTERLAAIEIEISELEMGITKVSVA